MAALKVSEGSKVQIKSNGRVGTVLNLAPQKTGQRGRPKTLAYVIHDDATEGQYGVADLKLV